MMRYLLFSDCHLTVKPMDEHRWSLFDMLREVAIKEKIDYFIGLGDLTESKDCHPGVLVNRLVNGLTSLTDIAPLILLQGNHDGTDQHAAYWSFLENIERIHYVDEPTWWDGSVSWYNFPSSSSKFLFLPHTRDPLNDWKDTDFTGKIVLAHVTIHQAMSESGYLMESPVGVEVFEKALRTYSGDIHRPQNFMLHRFTYVGCPYNIRFGDEGSNRVMILEVLSDEVRDYSIYLPYPRKLMFDTDGIKDFEEQIKRTQTLLAGEATYLKIPRIRPQAKVRLHITKENIGEWRVIQDGISSICKDYDIELSAKEMIRDYKQGEEQEKLAKSTGQQLSFDSYCDGQKITSELKEAGWSIVSEVFGVGGNG